MPAMWIAWARPYWLHTGRGSMWGDTYSTGLDKSPNPSQVAEPQPRYQSSPEAPAQDYREKYIRAQEKIGERYEQIIDLQKNYLPMPNGPPGRATENYSTLYIAYRGCNEGCNE